MACPDGLSGQPSDLNESFSVAGQEEVLGEVASRDRLELIRSIMASIRRMGASSRVRDLAKISSLIGSSACCNRKISVVEVASRCLVLIALTTCFISCHVLYYPCHVAEEDLLS